MSSAGFHRACLPGAGLGLVSEDRIEDAEIADELGKEVLADYLSGAT